MKIPVILLNYNSYYDCCQCCEDLQRQQGVEVEIVVVDNGSTGGEGEAGGDEAGRGEAVRGEAVRDEAVRDEAVKKLRTVDGLTLIEVGENRGYNAGNNVGLRYAAEKGYELALIANPDMRFIRHSGSGGANSDMRFIGNSESGGANLQEDYIKRLAEVFEKDEDIVVAASDIVGLDGRHQNPMKRDDSWFGCWNWVLDILHLRNRKNDTYDFIDNYSESHYCSKVSGCCLMVRLSFLQQMGFFDENVFLYCEEAILSRQVENSGKKMMYLADIQAVHAHKASAAKDVAQRFKIWRDSRIYFIRKYSGYSAFGKMMSILSMRVYCLTMMMFSRMKTTKTE